MPSISYDFLMAQSATDVAHAYTERDSMLYGMAVGMGRDPFDTRELDFVYERRGTLRSVPSQAVTVARHNLIYDIGLDVPKMLARPDHRTQRCGGRDRSPDLRRLCAGPRHRSSPQRQ